MFFFSYLDQRLMEDRTCHHCRNKNEDGSTLEPCSKCEGYKHHGCIEKCPVLEKRRFACLYSKLYWLLEGNAF